MFDQLLERNERQLRLHKSQIYRQMLDNQILLNQQYLRKQQASSRHHTQPKKASINVKPFQSSPKSKTEEAEQTVIRPKIKLPILQDKETLYKGFSNFLPEDTAANRKKTIREGKSHRGSDGLQESSSEDIQDILGELTTLNKQIVNSKHLKHKRLSSFGPLTRGNRQHRERKIDISHNTDSIKQAKQDQHWSPHPQTHVPTLPPSPNQSIIRGSQLRELAGERQTSRQQRNVLLPSHQAGSLFLNDQHSVEETNPQSNALQEDLHQQRDRFIQILRKVKNRGESLILKLTKYPAKVAS